MKLILYPDYHFDLEGPNNVEWFVEEALKEYRPDEVVICWEHGSDPFSRKAFGKMPQISQLAKDWLSGRVMNLDVVNPYLYAANLRMLQAALKLSERGVRSFPVDVDLSSDSFAKVDSLMVENEHLIDEATSARTFDAAVVGFVAQLKSLTQIDDIRHPEIARNIREIINSVNPGCVIVVYGAAHITYLKRRFDEFGYDVVPIEESAFQSISEIDEKATAAISRGGLTEEDRLSIARGMLLSRASLDAASKEQTSENAASVVDEVSEPLARLISTKVKTMDDAKAMFERIVSGKPLVSEDEGGSRKQQRLRELGINGRRTN